MIFHHNDRRIDTRETNAKNSWWSTGQVPAYVERDFDTWFWLPPSSEMAVFMTQVCSYNLKKKLSLIQHILLIWELSLHIYYIRLEYVRLCIPNVSLHLVRWRKTDVNLKSPLATLGRMQVVTSLHREWCNLLIVLCVGCLIAVGNWFELLRLLLQS